MGVMDGSCFVCLRKVLGILVGIGFSCLLGAQPPEVNISFGFGMEKGDMTTIWAWFGYDEPNGSDRFYA